MLTKIHLKPLPLALHDNSLNYIHQFRKEKERKKKSGNNNLSTKCMNLQLKFFS